MEPVELIPSRDGGPFSLHTKLGRCVVGSCSRKRGSNQVSCNRIRVKNVSTNKIAPHDFAFRSEVKEVTTENSDWDGLSQTFTLNAGSVGGMIYSSLSQ